MPRKLLNSELNRLSVAEYTEAEKLPIWLVLDNVRSQHNIGSAFRTADAFRIQGIALCGICATPPQPEMHKTALGAELTVLWRYFASTMEAVKWLKKQDYTLLVLEQAEEAIMLNHFIPEPSKRYALVFGNEVKGVAQEVVDASDVCLEIPQQGTKHSLNVSVSIGVALWDMVSKLMANHPFM